MAKKTKIGVILNTKSQETAAVLVEGFKKHPIYKKKYKVSKKFLAHNPKNKYIKDQIVKIQEVKPISKRKHFLIIGEVK